MRSRHYVLISLIFFFFRLCTWSCTIFILNKKIDQSFMLPSFSKSIQLEPITAVMCVAHRDLDLSLSGNNGTRNTAMTEVRAHESYGMHKSSDCGSTE